MKQRGMARRLALVASGIAIVGGLGLAGAAGARTVPGTSIKSGQPWLFTGGPACEVEVFNTHNHTFHGNEGGDKGTFRGGFSKVFMTWTRGTLSGATFKGETLPPHYIGTFTFRGAIYPNADLKFDVVPNIVEVRRWSPA